jgi:hypothetical protein
MEIKSLLIKDTIKEERERIIKESMDCGGGCENCSIDAFEVKNTKNPGRIFTSGAKSAGSCSKRKLMMFEACVL